MANAKLEVVPPKPINARGTMLDESRFRLVELDRQDWIANADKGTEIDDVTDPKYWALLAPRMKPFDHIELRADDGSWIANLVVIECSKNWAKVKILQKFDLTTEVTTYDSKEHRVEFKGPQHKWSVIRNADNEYIQDGFTARFGAEQWLLNFEANQ